MGLADEARPRPSRGFVDLLGDLAREPLVRRYSQGGYETDFELALRVRERSRAAAAEQVAIAEAAGRLQDMGSGEAMALMRFDPLLVCRRGIWHVSEKLPCQDSAACARDERSIALALCDGASTAPLAHYGSGLLARAAAEFAKRRADAHDGPLCSVDFLGGLHADLYLIQHFIAGQLGLPPSLAHELILAATVQLLIVRPKDSLVLALGDGSLIAGERCYDISRTLSRELSQDSSTRPPLLSYLLASDADGLSIDPARPDAAAMQQLLEELIAESQSLPLVSMMPTTQVVEAGCLGLETDGGRVRKRAANTQILQSLVRASDEADWLHVLALVDAATDETGDLIEFGLLQGLAQEQELRDHFEAAVFGQLPDYARVSGTLVDLAPALLTRFLAAGPKPKEAPQLLLDSWPTTPKCRGSELASLVKAHARRSLAERFDVDVDELESMGDDYGLALLRN